MRTFVIGLTFGLTFCFGTQATAQMSTERTLRLAFNIDGTVDLTAQNVSARDILAEWARLCGCHVVNAERLTGGAIMLPLQFERASQSAVLQSLLRQAAGYVLTPRRATSQSASNYETIFILPTSSPTTAAYVPPPASNSVMVPTRGVPDDELPPVVPIPNATAAPPQNMPATSTASNPFGSRTSAPSVYAPGSGTPGMPSPTVGAPGSVTPAPPAPMPYPGGPGPLPPGAAVPIIAVPPPGQ
jgi:hypothetical protein